MKPSTTEAAKTLIEWYISDFKSDSEINLPQTMAMPSILQDTVSHYNVEPELPLV